MHFSMRVHAFKVVHPGAATETADPTVDHRALAVGTLGNQLRLILRAIEDRPLNFKAPL
jgi:hypothetical protein